MIILFTIIFFLFVGISKVDALSYKFNNPTLHRICEGDLVGSQSGNCITNNNSNEVWANDQPGFWTQVAYRTNTNNNGVGGTTYEPGNYSIAFSGYLHVKKNSIIDDSSIRLKLLYYPTSDNQYGKATCDSGEIFRIQEINTATLKYYYYTYSCETLTITEGKSYVGYEIYVPGFVAIGVNNIPVTIGNQIENNMIIGGPSDTQDIINNFNQNFNDLIFNQNQNQQQTNQGLQDIEDAITDESSPSLDSFNNMTGWLPPGPLDSVLNLPLNVLNGFVNVFNNGTCASVYLPLPFLDSDLEIPCIYSIYSQIDGLNIFLTSIFTAITGYFMFKYLCNLYVWIDDRLKMKESDYMSDWGGV